MCRNDRFRLIAVQPLLGHEFAEVVQPETHCIRRRVQTVLSVSCDLAETKSGIMVQHQHFTLLIGKHVDHAFDLSMAFMITRWMNADRCRRFFNGSFPGTGSNTIACRLLRVYSMQSPFAIFVAHCRKFPSSAVLPAIRLLDDTNEYFPKDLLSGMFILHDGINRAVDSVLVKFNESGECVGIAVKIELNEFLISHAVLVVH